MISIEKCDKVNLNSRKKIEILEHKTLSKKQIVYRKHKAPTRKQ